MAVDFNNFSTRVEILSNNQKPAKAFFSSSFLPIHAHTHPRPGPPGGSVDFIIRISDGPACLLAARKVREWERERERGERKRERELYYICGEKVQIDITHRGRDGTGGGSYDDGRRVAKDGKG